MSGDVPKGWRQAPLVEHMTLFNGRAYKQAEMLRDGPRKIIRIQNLKDGDDWYFSDLDLPDHQLCHDGDLLFAWSATFGPYWWRGPEAIYHYHIWKVVVQSSLDKLFGFYLLEALTVAVKSASHGGLGMLHMTKAAMERWPISVPPLPEQKKIAAILSSVDEAIQATQAVIDQARRVKEGLLQDLLTRGIGHTRFKQTEIGEIPESWGVMPLENVLGKLIDYRGKPPPKAEKGIQLLTAKNVRDGYINPEPREFIPNNKWDEWMVRGFPQIGDVLFTTEAPLGMAAMLLTDRVALGQRLLCLRVNPSVYHGGFLLQMLLSSGFQDRCASLATGSTALGIKQSTFRQMLVPVPPLAEQSRIAEIVGQVATTNSGTENNIIQLKSLKSGLLQDLLTGKVRVNP